MLSLSAAYTLERWLTTEGALPFHPPLPWPAQTGNFHPEYLTCLDMIPLVPEANCVIGNVSMWLKAAPTWRQVSEAVLTCEALCGSELGAMLSVSLQSLAESSSHLLRHCPVHSTAHGPTQALLQIPRACTAAEGLFLS